MGCDCLADPDGYDSTDGAPPLSKNESRGCTDCLCAIIFVLFIIGMGVVAGFAIAAGSVERVIYGYDSYGNVCGMKNDKFAGVQFSGMDMSDRPYVFFMDVLSPDDSIEICVKECPTMDLADMNQVKDFAKNGSKLCLYSVEVDDYPSADQDKKGPCPVSNSLKKSSAIFNRCIPDNLEEFGKSAIESALEILNSNQFITKIIADLYIARWAILGMCGLAFVFALLMVFLIRFVASFIVWIIYILAIGSSAAVTGLLWYTYTERKKEMEKYGDVVPESIESDVTAFLIYSIVSTVFFVVLLLIILVMRKRVAFAVELLDQAGKGLVAMPLLLIQPLWTFIALLLFFAYWSVVMLFLSVTGNPTQYNGTDGEMYVEYNKGEVISYFWWYHLIGLIWIAEFILACQQFVIGACVADWYFTRDKESFSSPILRNIGYLIRYHFGSVAFGAFIITLVKIPRAILLYMQKKLKGTESEVLRFMLKCLSCCLWCLEKFLKFLNANAYTVIAIEGRNFCFSAKRAFLILVSNALRVAAINCVGDFVLFLGKLGVAGLTVLCGILILESIGEFSSSSYTCLAVPLLIGVIFAYFITSAFICVYEMTVDCLLICFCEDTRVNDGSPEKPYYMEKGLMEFVNNSSKAIDNEDKPGPAAPQAEDVKDAAPEEVEPALKSEKLYPDLNEEGK
ncbi:choline transporter-like protein 1 isoform X2 [Anneissia japonica]|uniref:choline transporter-like protein 1 isoform X2 n=1 Tax=Anneissia japonica TaxID=1529436 RepID=UPI001425A2A3|nr:choline transporter-like protein 1 isoform X2 [Anneissia japonica]